MEFADAEQDLKDSVTCPTTDKWQRQLTRASALNLGSVVASRGIAGTPLRPVKGGMRVCSMSRGQQLHFCTVCIG